ncbi:PAS domain S-box protein [Haloterrigena sp. SYSU A121-1]|uniref:histidine kinase n=1 Tax=Haloterrigena gelatinilytica TaxID=2741724 RepID=A0A8J8GNW3_9EURY|nr:ATP-binding protein [Haloterrigena gelatinilytica]NUB92565.1 PAS domain S-box protein [Haloterrigena gelatinilytica]
MTTSPNADPESNDGPRIRRQEVVADLGQQALETDDLDELLHDAVTAVAETLDAECASVFELLPGGGELRLRRGVGWSDDLVGTATIPADSSSYAGETLRAAQPVVVEDLDGDDRFSGSDRLGERDVSSGLSVSIGPDERPWGLLRAHATDRRSFSDRDAVFLRSVATVLASATENARAERRFEAIFEDPNILVGLLEPDGTVLDINGTAMEYIDADLEDVTGEPFWETPWWGEGDDVRSDVREWTRRAANGEYVEFETDLTRPSGERYTIDGVFRPVTDDDGDVVSIIVSDRDVTERKERERYLEDAKAQLEAATEAGAVGTWEWHLSGDEFVAGASFARTFGIDPEAARDGVPLESLLSSIHEDDRDRVERQIETAVENCDEYEAEYRVRNADDELRWVVARGHVEADDDGNPETFPGALTDITDRKRAELEAEKQRKQLETLFQVLPVGAVVADADGSLLTANDTAREIWGDDVFDAGCVDEYAKYDAVWADSGEPVDPEDWTMAQVLQGEAVTEPNVYEIDAFDGERRVIMEHGMPVTDECGEVTRGVVTLTDITERREFRRKLEESNERLEQFAYAASHDLQEPLRMVTSYLRLLENRYGDAFDEDGQEFLDYAVDGAERMSEMIDGLLAYSRIETRGDPLEPVDLETVLDDVIDDLQFQIDETDAALELDALPTVEGDASQLRQVFQNLLDNALTYHGDEPPRISVDAERQGDQWELSVRDAGIGIAPDDQERVFTVFDRLHGQEEYDGTGIGLALCQRIVERHGGEIRIDSEPGEGTTFSFTLPAAE